VAAPLPALRDATLWSICEILAATESGLTNTELDRLLREAPITIRRRATRDGERTSWSSLVACAAATDRTLRRDITQLGTAVFEGWIHLPAPDSFETLAPAAT
jgi:hypothetical protein